MKVHELIALLQKVNQDAEVIMSKDGEGNGFSPLADVEDNPKFAYVPDSKWSGDHTFIGPCDKDYPEEDWGEPYYAGEGSDAIPAVFLWPTN